MRPTLRWTGAQKLRVKLRTGSPASGDGKRITGDRLRPRQDAKTVRVRSGKVLVTDGPFTESKEAIVGFDILECDSLEEAIEIAARHPMARAGRLELRAFWPFE